VLGMKERDGRMETAVIPDVKMKTLKQEVTQRVEKGAVVSTDELMSYGLLAPDGYKHGAVNHSQNEWAYYDYRHDVTPSTNQVENFRRHFKHAITSTHIHVSSKHMDCYLNEFVFSPEPSRDGERGVRSADCFCVAVLAARKARSRSRRFAGPTPRASSWAMNSGKRPSLIASAKVRLMRSIPLRDESRTGTQCEQVRPGRREDRRER